MPRSVAATLVAVAALVAALLGPVEPAPSALAQASPVDAFPSALAQAAPVEPVPPIPVWPGLSRRPLAFALADGLPQRADVLEFSADDEALTLRPVLAQDRVAGLETVPGMGRRLLAAGAVAGINGGFWRSDPVGDPNSYLALDGALVSDAETQGAGPRGTFAVGAGSALLMDRLDSTTTVDAPGLAAPVAVTGVNRRYSAAPPYPDGDRPAYLYTPHYGAVDVGPVAPPGRPEPPFLALVVDGLVPRAAGPAQGTVSAVTTTAGTLPVPAGGAVIVGHGEAAVALSALAPGTPLTVDTVLEPLTTPAADWTDVVQGLAAGPLIVAGGAPTDPADWEDEGFAPQVHSDVRAPRSAIGVTADRRILLVTVDGRQPGTASGMTIAELARFLVGLGAVDALSLDGGGSTQLATDGLLRNRACCDEALRPVADGLFVFHDYAFAASERLAGDRRETTAAAVAAAGWPEGAREVLLAAAGGFPDALAGGPLAAALDAPLLLTGPTALPDVTAAALADLDPETVTVLGGEAAVGERVVAALGEAGYGVRRLAGPERTATAAAVATALGPRHPRAFLAAAGDFPDALTAAAPAGLLGAPVLLSGPAALPESTTALLADAEVAEVVVTGGTAAIGETVTAALEERGVAVTRLAGADRFGTARAVNEWALRTLDLDPGGLVVARGDAFPDALAGGPLAARRRQLLTIVPGIDVNANRDSAAFLAGRDDALRFVTLLGGPAGLSSFQHWQLDQLAR